MTPSVKTERPPAFPSSLKLPVAVLGSNPAIKSGVSAVQVGVNGLLPSSFEVVIEMTGETTDVAGVPPTVMAL